MNTTLDPELRYLISGADSAPLTTLRTDVSEHDFYEQQQKIARRASRASVIGIICIANSSVALVQRSGSHPGWALPSGKVESRKLGDSFVHQGGESFETAFTREMEEELGLTLPAGSGELLQVEERVLIQPSGEALSMYVGTLLAHTDQSVMQTASATQEGLQVASFSIAEIPELIFDDRAKITAALIPRAA